MNDKLIVAGLEMENLKRKLEDVMNSYSGLKDLENKIALREIENVIDQLDLSSDRIKYFSLPAIEGFLNKLDGGKFELNNFDGERITYFSCGDRIECYLLDEMEDKNKWFAGRVEHTIRGDQAGYYFYNSDVDHPFLTDGMKVRIRRDVLSLEN